MALQGKHGTTDLSIAECFRLFPVVAKGTKRCIFMDVRSLSVASMLYFANVYLFIFYGRLILRPRLTEVRETFTRGGPWVWIEKLLLLGFFPGPPQTTGWAKKWRNLAYFETAPANFLLSRPNAGEYGNSEKKLVKHRWLLYTCAAFGEQTPEIHAPYYSS